MTTDKKDISNILTDIDQKDDFLEDERESLEDIYNSDQDDERDIPDDDDIDDDDDESFDKRWYS